MAGDAPAAPERTEVMLAILAAVLIVAWLLGFLAFHVTVGFIHILLILGIILLVVHFMRGRGGAV
jgi:undecaprenyl pyrophosphate phosphatase UppP